MRRFIPMATLFALWFISTTAWAQNEVLKAIPDDAVAFVLLNNAASVSDKLQALAKQVKAPIGGSPLEMLKAFGFKNGLDEKGSAAIVVLPPLGQDQHVVALIPVTDYKAFIGQLNPVPFEGDISQIQIFGSPTLVASAGSYAVLGPPDGKADIQRMMKITTDVTTAVAPLKDWLANTDIAFVSTASGIKTGAQMAIDNITSATRNRQALAGAGPEAQQALQAMDAMMSIAKLLKDEANHFGLGLRIDSAGGVHLVSQLGFVPGGQLAGLGKTAKSLDDKPLAGLPSGPYALAGASVMPKNLVDALMTWSMQMQEASPQLKTLTPEQKKRFVELALEAMQGVNSVGFALLASTDNAPLYSNMMGVTHVDDANKTLANMEKSQKEMQELLKDTNMPGKISKVEQTTVGSLQAVAAEIDVKDMFGMSTLPPQAVEQIKAMAQKLIGSSDTMTAYSAVLDPTTTGAAYINKDNLLKLSEAVQHPEKSLTADAEITKTAAMLPKGAFAVAYLNPQGLAETVRQFMAAFGQPAPIPNVPVTPPVGAALKVSEAALEAEVVVPSDTITILAGLAQQPQPQAGQLQLQGAPGQFQAVPLPAK